MSFAFMVIAPAVATVVASCRLRVANANCGWHCQLGCARDVGVFACLIENCVSALLMNGKKKQSRNALHRKNNVEVFGTVITQKTAYTKKLKLE